MKKALESHRFTDCQHFKDPLTGREWQQLTSCEDFCCPLYYFGHVASADGGTVLFYRYRSGEVQNWKLEIASGVATRLTSATTPNCLRHFWLEAETACGVREHMSCFSPASEELAYFDGNTVRAVHIRSLEDRVVFELPEDRVPTSIPSLSPSGKSYALSHVDRQWWEEVTNPGPPPRHEAKKAQLDVVNMANGDRRNLITMNSVITHVDFYDESCLLFTHLATEEALLMTDLRGGWFAALRTQTPEGALVNHGVATQRGIFYETVSPLPHGILGHCNPDTYKSSDFLTNHPVHHVGHDWEGRLLFADIYQVNPPHERHLAWLPTASNQKVNEFTLLTHGFHMHGKPVLQRSHIHGTLMPNRQKILFTGPDDRNKTNQLFFLDVSDLADKETRLVFSANPTNT